jgi:4-amino-4-deoxy-L-arabinose transferase-like glycosyltransferase
MFILLVYWLVSLDGLSIFPPVGEDEPWIAAAPYKLAAQGVYGSDLFAGYYGLDLHNYQHMPLYPLLQALTFKVAGVGVLQMRFLPVSCGLLILPLVFAVGRQTADGRVGILAMVLLTGLRLASGWQERTGIPLLDIARINRYDIAVPLFGLVAFWAFNKAERQRSAEWYVLTGALVGMSSLSHLYGVFWLPALLAICLYRRGLRLFREGTPYLAVTGLALVWLPWAIYVAAGWTDYLGQMQFISSRFDVLNPHFYSSNLLGEIDRYRLLDMLDPSGRLRLARPGSWTVILGLPVAEGTLLLQGRRDPDDSAFALAAALAIQALMFALLLEVKHYNYAIALFPLAFLVLAWLGIRLWDRSSAPAYRGVLLALLLLVLAEGGVRVAHRRAVTARTTPYDEFEARVANHIPSHALVVGLQHYWLGLRQYRYRTWLLPLLRTGQATDLDEPVALDQALERVDPDVILLDRHMGGYFDSLSHPSHPDHETYAELQRFMTRHRAQIAGTVEDVTYGTMRVYWVNGAATETLGP